MRKFLLLPFIVLFFLILFPTTSHAQTAAEITNFLSCGDQTSDVQGQLDAKNNPLYKSCSAGPITGLPVGVLPTLTFTVLGDGYNRSIDIPASSLGNSRGGQFTYCGMTESGQSFSPVGIGSPYFYHPRITDIKFTAPGYTSQSYKIFKDDPCFTATDDGKKATQVGGILFSKESDTIKHYGCVIYNNVSTCAESTSISDDTDPACSNTCKTFYLYCADTSCTGVVCSLTDTPDPILKENARYKDRNLGPFASEKFCNEGRDALANESQYTPPPKDLPPCKTKISDKGCSSVYSAFGTLSTNPQGFLTALFSILLSLSGGIALLFIIRSGYQLMTSQGDPEKVKDARERITSAIVGLLFIVFSLVILEVIGVDILAIPGLSR